MTELALQLPSPHERVLLHELNHRINNEFAAAISAVSVAAARSSHRAVKAALSGVESCSITTLMSIAPCRRLIMTRRSTLRRTFINSASQ